MDDLMNVLKKKGFTMSHYFRTAAKCDVSVAVKSPVPLYNDPAEEDTSPTKCAVSMQEEPASMIAEGGDAFQRSRAALDRPLQQDIRRTVKREANVLANLARHQEQQRVRLQEEAKLNEKVLAAVAASRGGDTGDRKPPDGYAASSPKRNPLRTPDNNEVARAPLVPFAGHTTTDEEIGMFQRIKVEEARCIRRSDLLGHLADKMDASYGGSIISLYNALTLDAVLAEDPTTPPSVLIAKEASKFIPTVPTERNRGVPTSQASGDERLYGEKQFSASDCVSASRNRALKQRLEQLHAEEVAAHEKRAALRGARDHDAMTILQETMEQDHMHREFLEASRLLKLMQHHQSSLVGAFDVENRTDPLLPQMPDDVVQAMRFAKKPPHPVDVYQAAVRDRMAQM
jgi:hypothetical protein